MPFNTSYCNPDTANPTLRKQTHQEFGVLLLVREPDDVKFITCAATAGVRWLVSGDNDLLVLRQVKSVEIISVMECLHHFKRKP